MIQYSEPLEEQEGNYSLKKKDKKIAVVDGERNGGPTRSSNGY